jgi:hypothetical protein
MRDGEVCGSGGDAQSALTGKQGVGVWVPWQTLGAGCGAVDILVALGWVGPLPLPACASVSVLRRTRVILIALQSIQQADEPHPAAPQPSILHEHA